MDNIPSPQNALTLDAFFTYAHHGKAIVSLEGKVMKANPALCRMLGYDEKQLLQLGFPDVTHPEDIDGDWEDFQRLVTGDLDSYERKKRYIASDGTIIWARLTVSAIRNDRGELVAVAGQVIDISEQVQTDLKLRAALAKLELHAEDMRRQALRAEETSTAKTRLLANASHEIRTPMNGVIGTIQLLLQSTALTEGDRRLAQNAMDSAQDLLTVINDILDTSQIENGTFRLRVEPIGIDDVFESLDRSLKSLALNKGLSLSFTEVDDLPEMVSDRVRLRQILMNLIGNAIKYTDKGGICVSARYVAQQERILFKVADTGPGIPEEMRTRIFEPFVQVDAVHMPRQSNGLGLSICRDLAELLGGRVWVEAGAETGSVFYLDLPRVAAHAITEITPSLQAPSDDLSGMSVLVVDDNVVNREIVKACLQQAGAAVTEACDGVEAVEIATGADFDAILMDEQMPVLSGPAAAAQIRARDASIGGRIIAFSANDGQNHRAEWLSVGVRACVPKPVDFRQLTATLSALKDRAAA